MEVDGQGGATGQQESVTPAGIAHNNLFTAKEKTELLNQLKADATVAQLEGLEPSFALDEIERALAEVRHDVEEGHGTQTLSQGES
jgi:hypothetical protein